MVRTVPVDGLRVWRVVVALAAIACVPVVGTLGVRTGASAEPAAAGAGAHSVPLAARGIVSQTLGAADLAAYAVHDLRADNAAQRLRVTFGASGVTVASGALRVGFTTVAGPPLVIGNRVTYTAPGIREWWVNGPRGLEQGFDVAHAPAGAGTGGSLQLLLRLSGDARARATGSGLLLSAGGRKLRYGGVTAVDASGRRLRARLLLRGRRIVLAVDVGGATYPVRIDPFVEQQKLTVPDETNGEATLGTSVAMSSDGSTLLVGGPDDGGGPGGGAGAAWVFVRSASGKWIEQQKITASDESGGDTSDFGDSVALSSDGNMALIGGPQDNTGVGAVWVFTRSGHSWSEVAKLPGLGAGLGGEFGASVAL